MTPVNREPHDSDEGEQDEEYVPRRHGYGRRTTDLGPFIGALSPTWQAGIVILLAIGAGMGAQAAITAQRGLPARVAVLEIAIPKIMDRVEVTERELQGSPQMRMHLRYLVCRARAHDAGQSAKGCEYLYSENAATVTLPAERVDTKPTPDRPIYREEPQ